MLKGLIPTAIFFVFAAPLFATAQAVLSTYVGGPQDDRLAGCGIQPDGTIVVGGVAPAGTGEAWKGATQNGAATGEGVLLRIASSGNKVLSMTRLEGSVSDVDLDAQGNIYVVGSGGASKWDPAGAKKLWSVAGGDKDARIRATPDGGAVVLVGKKVAIIDSNGAQATSFSVSGGFVNDLLYDAANKHVIVAGFDNKKGKPPKQKTEPVQVAFIHAFDLKGERAWKAYGWGGQEVADRELMADTRAYRLAMGSGGKIWVAGESAGGNTMWLRSSLNLEEKTATPKGDKFQNSYNTSANHITFVGRLDARTGQSEFGTMLLARLGNTKGNTIRPRALAVDEQGRVYVGGMSASSPPVTTGAFGDTGDGGGAFLCVFSPELNRLLATKLGNDQLSALAVRGKRFVAVGSTKDQLTLKNAWQSEPGGGKDGFVTILETPDANATR